MLAAIAVATPIMEAAPYWYEIIHTESSDSSERKDVTLNIAADGEDSATWKDGTGDDWAVGTVGHNRTVDVVQNATVNMTGGKLTFLSPDGDGSGVVFGKREVNISGGEVTYLVAGAMMHGVTDANHYNQPYNPNSPNPYVSPEDVVLNISGGKVGQIRGGLNANGGGIIDPTTECIGSYKLGGDVIMNIAGSAQIGGMGEKDAIRGAGGSHCCVDGNVQINISENANVIGNIYAGARNGLMGEAAYVGGTEINISGGTITGNVYAGGSHDDGYHTIVQNDTNITITGGTINGDVYGAGNKDIVEGNTTVKLLGGSITGSVYGGGTDGSEVRGSRTLLIGSADKAYKGSVTAIGDFTEVIVAAGSSITQREGNIFSVKEQTYTLSAENLREACVSGATADVEGSLSITLTSNGKLSTGKYMLVKSDAAPTNWNNQNVTVNGIGGFDDTVWEGNILYLIYKQWNVDAAIVSNWGVFKSSQAFTGTLWGNRSNAVVLDAPAKAHDGKAPSAAATQTAPATTTLAWASAYGQSGRISNAGADYSLYGAAMGIERQFGAKGRSIGVAFGYDWGKVSPFTTTSADQETWHAALYGRAGAWKAGKGTVSVDWSVAYGDTTTEHNDFASDWSQDSWQLDVRATYAQALSERATASVFAGVQYYTHDDATVDNMHISSLQNLRLTAGAGLSYAATARTNVYGQASIYFDAMRHNPHVDTNGACFKGTNPGRIGGVLSVGTDYAITDRWTLRGAYSFDAAKDSTEHNVNAGVQYSF